MTTNDRNQMGYDAIVIGGGPAGLQAALTLARMHRPVLLLDSGTYRNDPADAMHNMAGFDGVKPADYRAAAHRDLSAYADAHVRHVEATTVSGSGEEGFRVDLADGTTVWARRLVLATGVRDTLADTPGLADLFGTVAAHCPFCHGHEYAGTHVALVGPHAPMLALMLEKIAPRRTVLTDGAELGDDMLALVERAGLGLRTEPIASYERTADGARIHFAGGPTEEVGGIMVATTFAQSAPFAAHLGLDLLGSGCVEVDAFGHTSVPGVYAAGDLAHVKELPMPMASVLTAAAAGQLAAATAVRELSLGDSSAA